MAEQKRIRTTTSTAMATVSTSALTAALPRPARFSKWIITNKRATFYARSPPASALFFARLAAISFSSFNCFTPLTSSTFLILKISSLSNSSNSAWMYLMVFAVRGITTCSAKSNQRGFGMLDRIEEMVAVHCRAHSHVDLSLWSLHPMQQKKFAETPTVQDSAQGSRKD